mmetsp:Transcript_108868/g.318557  ORF Transcript_108868/g.318557 Transcript_108868/m.318557 type:complete len:296 (-) Transcript_108868:2511-3398(-)
MLGGMSCHRQQSLLCCPSAPGLRCKNKYEVSRAELQLVTRIRHHVARPLLVGCAVQAQCYDPLVILPREEGTPEVAPSAEALAAALPGDFDLPEQRLVGSRRLAVLPREQQALHGLHRPGHVVGAREHRAQHYGREDLARGEARAVQQLEAPVRPPHRRRGLGRQGRREHEARDRPGPEPGRGPGRAELRALVRQLLAVVPAHRRQQPEVLEALELEHRVVPVRNAQGAEHLEEHDGAQVQHLVLARPARARMRAHAGKDGGLVYTAPDQIRHPAGVSVHNTNPAVSHDAKVVKH